MKRISRRNLLKGGLAMPVVAAVGLPETETPVAVPLPASNPQNNAAQSALRERLLLDFGWRFHFGHANDAKKDFGFGLGRSGGFQKTGEFLAPSHMAFDDSAWTPVALPHDWVIGLPFKNDANLTSKGSYPVGRDYPDTSVGWYRRVFELPQTDTGKRISLEFDGAYRETMVVVNGYYIGRHSGGRPAVPLIFVKSEAVAVCAFCL